MIETDLMHLVVRLTALALVAFIAVSAVAICVMELQAARWARRRDRKERARMHAQLTQDLNEVWAAMKMRDELMGRTDE